MPESTIRDATTPVSFNATLLNWSAVQLQVQFQGASEDFRLLLFYAFITLIAFLWYLKE